MENEICQEMLNLNAMLQSTMHVILNRVDFVDDNDAQTFFDVGCQYLSSILFARYQREKECHSTSEAK